MNTTYDYDLVCIGSGPAGQRAAVQAAKLGKRVAVVERGNCVGGGCLANGTIPSKTFREAVRAMTRFLQHDHGLGIGPKIKPTASQLLSRVQGVQNRESDVVRDQLQRNDINVIVGHATFEDPHRLSVDTGGGTYSVTAENVLIAVGTRPATPPGVTLEQSGPVIVSDGVMDLEHLPRTIAVVGGGVIGVEYACMFAALGCKVTLVDRRSRLLEFLDREIVDELMHQMRGQGVAFRMGEAVSRLDVVEQRGQKSGLLRLESGKRIVADLVLFSIGRVGATDRLGLSAAGLEADGRGRLKVDEHYQTTVPHIYAAGDVIGFPSLAATSGEQGRLAARYMFGAEQGEVPALFPFGIYSIPEISTVGATEEQLTEDRVPYEVGLARYREIARGQILGDSEGLLKMLFHRDTEQLLGVHIIGTGATELVHTGQAVMALEGGLPYFLDTVFNYPTLAECYKVAALDAYNKLRLARLCEHAAAAE